jgi:hypothetical protein
MLPIDALAALGGSLITNTLLAVFAEDWRRK